MTPFHHHLAAIFLCCVLSVFLLPDLVHAGRGRPTPSTCAVGISSITIQEEFESDNGGSVLFCRGTATVNQCEGECTSQSSPSVSERTFFAKVCKCCREESMRPKEVILTECYDSNGNALVGQNYPVYVPEPASCSCHECSL